MAEQPAPVPSSGPEPYSRFEIELEFVQCLANPFYLNFLAQSQLFSDPAFLAYLDYLEYFRQPAYTKLLTYPKYSLNALSLLKQPAFRIAIISPHVAKMMFDDGVAGVTAAGVRARLAGEVPAATGENGAGGAGLANGGAGEAEKTNGNGAGGR